MATDQGSVAEGVLATWAQDLPEGWFYLGHTANAEYNTSPIIVIELAHDILADVADWRLFGTNEWSGNPSDFTLWSGYAAGEEYVLVGGMLATHSGCMPPTTDQTRGIKAVRTDTLKVYDSEAVGLVGRLFPVWVDKGPGATRNGPVWSIGPVSNSTPNMGFPTSLIPVGACSYNLPPADSRYLLSPDTTSYAGESLPASVDIGDALITASMWLWGMLLLKLGIFPL